METTQKQSPEQKKIHALTNHNLAVQAHIDSQLKVIETNNLLIQQYQRIIEIRTVKP